MASLLRGVGCLLLLRCAGSVYSDIPERRAKTVAEFQLLYEQRTNLTTPKLFLWQFKCKRMKTSENSYAR